MALTERLSALTPEQRALFEKLREQKKQQAPARAPQPPPIARRGAGDHWPLSFDQERLWFLCMLNPEDTAYNIDSASRIRGPVDSTALERAFQEIPRRHEIWRTAFPAVDGRPVQVVLPEMRLPNTTVDLRTLPRELREPAAHRLMIASTRVPFVLETGPLVRALLLRLDDEECIVQLVVHHIVTDWVTFQLFWREIGLLYDAFVAGRTSPEQSPLPPPIVQFADYTVWQREWMRGEVEQYFLRHWIERLRDVPLALEIPTDRPRPPVMTSRGDRVPVRLDRAAELKAMARREGLTPFMAVLAAYQLVLARWSGQDKVIVGSPNANRNRIEIQEIFGFFLTQLPFCADVSGDPTLREALSRARDVALAAYAHQDLPFGKLVEALHPERDMSRSPIIQFVLLLLDGSVLSPRLAGLEVTPVDVHDGNARYDVMFAMWDHPELIHGWYEYNADLWDKTTAARLVEAFHLVIEAMLADPERHLSEVVLLSPAARHQVRRRPAGGDAGRDGKFGMSDAGARLAQLSAEERALLFEKLRRRREQEAGSGPDADRQPIPRRPDREAPTPLSFAQQRLWFLDRLSPGEPSYNIGATVIVDGPLDEASLDRALQAVVDQHESLRTTFAVAAGSPVQIVAPRLEVPISLIDLSVASDPGHSEVMRACRQMLELPFDPSAGPLLRVLLLSLGLRRHILALSIHHIVSDGWSMNLLVDDLVAVSRGVALPPLPVQYADYAVWQRDRLRGERLDRLLAVWRRRLGDLPEVISLPTDRPRPPVKSAAGAALSFALAADTVARLQAAAREEGATPFMLLLAVYEILLSRWSGQETFAVGSIVANRNRSELERLVGFFANTLALRADLGGAPAVRELLARIRETTVEAFAHQEVPFEKLVEELRPARDPSRSPIFQVSLSLQNTPRPKASLGELGMTHLEIPVRHVKFDLEASFDHGETGGLRGKLVYSTALFDAATAERLTGHFRTLLAALLEDRGREIADLPLLTAAEVRQLEAWNRTRVPGPRIAPEDRFAALAAEAPGAPALVSAAGTVTRGELDAAADRLARRLRRLGVGPEVPVGVVLPRSPELVLAALAVARSGGAYMPLDPAYPAERIAAALDDAGVGVLITAPGSALPPFQGTVIWLESKDIKDIKDLNDTEPPAAPASVLSFSSLGGDSLAYIVYTSGSTGAPKGVAVRRDALANLIAWNLRVLPVVSGDRAMLTAGPAFDASIWEIWLFLSGGAAIHVPDEETRLSPARLAAWMMRERITVTFLPTPLAEALLAEPAAAELPLRYLATGGDRLHRIPPGLPFPVANCYGPSEATVVTSASFDAAAGPGDRDPSVGRPIDNAQVWLLDAALSPVPVGVPGELWIGGEILARGYLGRPDWTAAAWRPDPFAATPGARMYRTGDLARRRPDGALEMLGRLDGQVKVRGFRIETGEIEAALGEHPQVRQAVVLPRDGADGRTLVAYLVAGAAGDDELRGHLRRRLPELMVPALFVRLPALPLTPAGKVDRAALELCLAQMPPPASPPKTAPRTAAERTLAALWAEVLDRPEPGVDESFFDLGGHSLLLTRLQTRIGEEMGCDVPMLKLMEHPTISAFAAWLEEGEGEARPAPGENRDRAQRQRQALELQRQRLARRPPGR